MYLLPLLVSVVASLPDYRLLLIAANNVHHMTIERARTPKEIKRFRVLDAETGAPMKGAHVIAVHNFDWMDDWETEATTGPDGVARVELAKEYLHLLHVDVAAKGYLRRDYLLFGDRQRSAGAGRLVDDPVEIRLFKGPEPVAGLRVPVNFRGTIVYAGGGHEPELRYPPAFPLGQRVWWTDAKPGELTRVPAVPNLGYPLDEDRRAGAAADDDDPELGIRRVSYADGRAIRMVTPGADVPGVAAWRIGTTEPNGPWGRQNYVIVIGERGDAVAEARRMWERYHNGREGYVLNGWLAVVSPETKPNGSEADGVTRVGMDR